MVSWAVVWEERYPCSCNKGLCNSYLEGMRRAGKWMKYAPKLSHTPLSLRKINFNSPSHNDDIKTNLPPWKRSPSIIDSLIPSLPVGFLRLVQTSLQMTLPRRVIRRVIRITGVWACVVFSWTGRFLMFNSISHVQVQEIDCNKACWRDLLNFRRFVGESEMLLRTTDWAHSGLFEWSSI